MPITRIRNNQVYNSDLYADAKVVAKSISGGLLSDNFTYTGNMTIGNLTVNGNTTTVDTTNLVIADPIFSINRNQSGAPSYDLGIVMGRGNQTNVAFIWEEQNKQFQLQYTTESTATTTFGVINNSGYANLQAYGALLNNATITTATLTNSIVANTATSGGTINNTTIGATTPNTGVFTSVTTSSGGQHIGYHTGAIGANSANTGAFTTLSTTDNATIGGNITITGNIIPTASNVYSLGSPTLRFSNLWLKGTTIYLGALALVDNGGYLQIQDVNGNQLGIQTAFINNTIIGNNGAASGTFTSITASSASINGVTIGTGGQINGYLNGTIGANAANSATFTTANVNGVLYVATLNGGTIGNVGASITGSSGSFNTVSGGLIGNSGALLQGTLISASASQPNITSVGTLTSLTVSGTVSANQIQAGVLGNSGALLNGTLVSASASQPNITSLGTLTSLTVSGTASANQVQAGVLGNSGALLNGTLVSAAAAQPNITSVGNLTSLVSTGNITATTSNVYAANFVANTASYSPVYYYSNGVNILSPIIASAYSNANAAAYLTVYNGAILTSNVYGYINGQIGANAANSATFTTVNTTSTITAGGTITGSGQVIGYFNGAIGANTANSGAFTTVSATSTITSSGNITAQTANVYGANFVANTASYSPVYYYSNGVNILSPIIASAYSNANAAAYLTVYNGAILTSNVYGYINGQIGANAANSATFTTVNITNTANSYGSSQGALQIGGGFYAGGDSYIRGNLIVGNLQSIGYQNLIVNDPLLYLSAANVTSYNYDIGFFSHKYDTLVGYNHTGLVRRATDNNWYLFSNITTEPDTTVDLGNANIVFDTLLLGNMVAYSGNASTSKTTGAVVVYGGIGAQGNIYAGAIQNTPIGNGTASTGAFTTLTTSSTIVSQGTITGANQVIGYFNGAIGANTANSGAFTTIITTGNITATTANVYAANLIGNTALYGAQYYWTNGATLASTITGTYSNSNVASYLPTYTGALTAGNVTTINGGQVIGYFNGAIGANAANSGAFTTVTASGTITGANQVIGYFNGAIGANAANSGVFTTVTASGNITATTANVYAANVLGNTAVYGAQYYWTNGATLASTITGSYSNSNVASYLPTYTGALTAGNVTTVSGGQLIGYLTGAIGANSANSGAFTTIIASGTITGAGQVVGYFNGSIGANTANSGAFTTITSTSTITAQGTVSAPTINAGTIGNSGAAFTGATLSTTSTITAQGTVSAPTINAGTIGNAGAVFTGANQTLTGNVNALNFNGGNAATVGNLIANGGIGSYSTTAGSLIVSGGAGISGNVNAGRFQVGQLSFSDTGLLILAQSSVNGYNQIVSQNTNNGASASTDFIVTNDQGTASTYYGDFGMNSSGFSGTGSLAAPNNVYLTSTSSDLVIGTTTSNAIRFVVNSGTTDSLIVNTNGNITIPTTTNSTSATTGALVIGGGVGVTGNINISANSYYGIATNTPSTYVSNIYPYANTGNVVIYTPTNTNLTVNGNQLVANLVVHGNSAAGYQNLLVTNGGSGAVGIKIAPNAITPNVSLHVNSTDAIIIPVGATANRPSNAQQGMVRFNTNNSQLEFYSGTSWQSTGSTFTVVSSDQFTGDGTTTAFTLSQSATTNSVMVAINGVIQIPVTAYSVSGTTLTFTEAPLSTDIIDARTIVTTSVVSSITDATGANSFVANANGSYVTAVNTARILANSSGNFFGGGISTLSANTSCSPNVPTIIDTFSTTTYRGAKYVVTLSDYTNNNFTLAEVVLVCGSSNATVQTYGVVSANGVSIGNFFANVSGTTARLYANAGVSSFAKVQQIYMPL